jgi:hypothetical protein
VCRDKKQPVASILLLDLHGNKASSTIKECESVFVSNDCVYLLILVSGLCRGFQLAFAIKMHVLVNAVAHMHGVHALVPQLASMQCSWTGAPAVPLTLQTSGALIYSSARHVANRRSSCVECRGATNRQTDRNACSSVCNCTSHLPPPAACQAAPAHSTAQGP